MLFITGLCFVLMVAYYYRKNFKYLIAHVNMSFFNKHRTIGKWMGITYTNTNDWSTSRRDTKMFFQGNVIFKKFGNQFPFGNEEAIYALKKRQRERTRDINLLKYFDKDMDLSLDEFERYLITYWLAELTEAYNIKKPDNEPVFSDFIYDLRKAFSGFKGNLQLIYRLAKMWPKMRANKPYMDSLTQEERMIITAPFLTTVDTCIINLVSKNKATKLSELFTNVPLTYGLFYHKDTLVFTDIVSNGNDNPGNSVFGPKGVVCPGNIVTSMLVKAMIDLVNLLDYEVIGEPVFDASGVIKSIKNRADLRIVTKAFHKEYVTDYTSITGHDD